jgi:hypothetical protein
MTPGAAGGAMRSFRWGSTIGLMGEFEGIGMDILNPL